MIYYIPSGSFPYSIDTYDLNHTPNVGYIHKVMADLERLNRLIKHYENILINTKKTERAKIRKKICKIKKKSILLKETNPEYFV